MKHFLVQAQAVMNHIEVLVAFNQIPNLEVTLKPLHDRPEWLDGAQLNVPISFVKDGKIVLNVNPSAVSNFNCDFEKGVISFAARFNGVSLNIVVPIEHINMVRNKASDQPLGFDYRNIPSEYFWTSIINPFVQVAEVKSAEKPKGRPALKLV